MSDYPTKASLDLGMRLVSCPPGDEAAALQMAMEEARMRVTIFGADPRFLGLVNALHQHMHHGVFAGHCEGQKQLLLAAMAKMFVAGWSAGRQEVIDAEVSRMERS